MDDIYLSSDQASRVKALSRAVVAHWNHLYLRGTGSDARFDAIRWMIDTAYTRDLDGEMVREAVRRGCADWPDGLVQLDQTGYMQRAPDRKADGSPARAPKYHGRARDRQHVSPQEEAALADRGKLLRWSEEPYRDGDDPPVFARRMCVGCGYRREAARFRGSACEGCAVVERRTRLLAGWLVSVHAPVVTDEERAELDAVRLEMSEQNNTVSRRGGNDGVVAGMADAQATRIAREVGTRWVSKSQR